MKTLLLLALFVASSLAVVLNVDCTTPTVALNLDDNCLTNYRKVNGTTAQAADALIDFISFCLGGGNTPGQLSPGDELVITGNCNLNQALEVLPANPGTGTLIIRGPSAGNRPTLTFQNNLDFITMVSDINTVPHTASVTLRDLIFTTTGATTNAQVVVADRGNINLDNVRFLDFNNNAGTGSGYIWHQGSGAGTNTGTIPQYTITVNNLEVLQTGSGIGNAVSAPIIRIETNVDVVATNINIHDTRVAQFIGVVPNGIDDQPLSINVTNFVANNVDYRAGNCFVLCSLGDVEFSDYTIVLDNIAVTSSDFTGATAAIIGWAPTYDQFIDGTFTLSNSNFDGNTFNRIFNTAGSAAIAVYGRGQTTFSDSTFNANTLTNPIDGNTLIFVENTDGAIFSGNTFTNNVNFVHGVVKVGAFTANTVLDGNTFDGNTGSSRRPFISRGGAVNLEGTAFVDNNDFLNNFAEDGGAVFINNVDVYFSGSTFDGNNATNFRLATFSVGYGGAVLKNMDGVVSFDGCTFTNNVANKAGGALAVIADNDLAGIAFYYGDGGDLLLSDCTFNGNNAPIGGALLFTSRNLIASDSNFTQNTATTGGAVSAMDINPFVSSPLLFRNCRFEDNTADGGDIRNIQLQDGGAVSTERAAQFTKSAFINNEAKDGNGGAITAYKGLSADSCKFHNNRASGVGGAVWSNPTQPERLDLIRSDFVQNVGTDGGALWTNNPATNLIGATFTDNSALQNGGACFLNTKASVDGTGFELNTANNDGGAIYSLGDVTITGSRFESNWAGNDGGAILCLSEPLGQVDYTLRSGQKTFMRNNTAVRNGGAIETTCNLEDTGTTYTESSQVDTSFGVECIGDLRQLRDCEMSFIGSSFLTDSLGIWAPTTSFGSVSSGLVILQSTFDDFDGFFQSETTTITDSKFNNHRIRYDSPTTISGSEFTGGNDQFLTGPTEVSGSSYSSGVVNVTHAEPSTFDTDTFESTSFTSYNGKVDIVDTKVTDNSNFTFYFDASLTRVEVDETSSTTSTATTTVADTTVGAYHGTTGSLVLTGDFKFGGEGLQSDLAIPVSGSGDFVMVGGVFTWTNGGITGAGDFIILAGEAHLQSGAPLDRITTAEEDAVVFVDNAPAFTLSTTFDAKGGAVFGQDTADGVVSIDAAGAGASFNTWKDTFWAPSTTVSPNHHNYGNYHFDIIDRNSYDDVHFEGTFETENSSFVFAQDERTVFYYEDTEFDNGTLYVQDLGTRFQIIELPGPFDIESCDCVSPFAGAVYTYNINTRYPNKEHEDFPAARISTRNESSDEATVYLYLYASASGMQPALFLIFLILALLF